MIWVEDPSHRNAFDEYLWNHEKLAFIPHISWEPDMGKVQDPIVLLGEPGEGNGSEILLVADGRPPEDWAGHFFEIHEFLPPGEAGEERKAWWEAWLKEREEETQ